MWVQQSAADRATYGSTYVTLFVIMCLYLLGERGCGDDDDEAEEGGCCLLVTTSCDPDLWSKKETRNIMETLHGYPNICVTFQ